MRLGLLTIIASLLAASCYGRVYGYVQEIKAVAISPDERTIAFIYHNGSDLLYVCNVDGSSLELVGGLSGVGETAPTKLLDKDSVKGMLCGSIAADEAHISVAEAHSVQGDVHWISEDKILGTNKGMLFSASPGSGIAWFLPPIDLGSICGSPTSSRLPLARIAVGQDKPLIASTNGLLFAVNDSVRVHKSLLTKQDEVYINPAWSPDEGEVAFQVVKTPKILNQAEDIVIFNLDSNSTTTMPIPGDWRLSRNFPLYWSKEPNRLHFVAVRNENHPDTPRIASLAIDGGGFSTIDVGPITTFDIFDDPQRIILGRDVRMSQGNGRFPLLELRNVATGASEPILFADQLPRNQRLIAY